MTNTTKVKFKQECNIDDTASKVLDLMNRLPEFQTEIESNIKIYRYSKTLFYYTSEDTFYAALKFTWILGLVVNIICILSYGYDKNTTTGKEEWGIENEYRWIIVALYLILGLISIIFLGLWFSFRYPEAKMLAYNAIKLDDNDLLETSWKFWYYKNFHYSIFKKSTPMMLFLHFALAILGFFFNPIFHTGHLFLILYLSTTARYVVRSITEHIS